MQPGPQLSQPRAPFLSTDRAWRTRSVARAHGQVFQVRDLEGKPALVAVQSPARRRRALSELILHGATGLGLSRVGRRVGKFHTRARLLAGLRALGSAGDLWRGLGRCLPLARGLGPRPDGSQLGGSVGNLERPTPVGAACVLVGEGDS